jgi:hypothetical protein
MKDLSDAVWSTTPMDRERVQALLQEVYEPDNAVIIWASNPLDGVVQATILFKKYFEQVLMKRTIQLSFGDKTLEFVSPNAWWSDSGLRWNALNSVFQAFRETTSTKFFTVSKEAENAHTLMHSWAANTGAWRQHYSAGYDAIQEHELAGMWGDVRRRLMYDWSGRLVNPMIGQRTHKPLVPFDVLEELVKNAWQITLFGSFCVVVERPCEIHLDADKRISRDPREGFAVRWADGAGFHAYKGVLVGNVGKTITIAKIDRIQNAEQRRVLVDLYGGMVKYLKDSGAEMIQADGFGELWKRRRAWDHPTEALALVKVVNFTPEPDGSYKDYFLRVPPTMVTAEQAVAWTFGKAVGEYNPIVQT